jgi:hypothetical protein
MPVGKEPAKESKIIQALPWTTVTGGDNSVEHEDGRVVPVAWGLCEDGTFVPLIRKGGTLVRVRPPAAAES